ncbi:MAG: hypothetical protein ACI9S9_001303, partial [Planctomycetota bacterium]
FVQDHQFGRTEQRVGQAEATLHAERVVLGLAIGGV